MRCEDGGKAPMIIRDTGFVAREEREGEKMVFCGCYMNFFIGNTCFLADERGKTQKIH